MTWTHFHDMHSGGGLKLDWPHIWIEAPEAEAIRIFETRFGRNPGHVTCNCCGEDYSLSESETLEQATAYERGCRWVEPDTTPRSFRGGRYLEPNEPVPAGYVDRSNNFNVVVTKERPRIGIPLDEFLRTTNCLVIRKEELNK